MRRGNLVGALIGLAVLAALTGVALFVNRGSHMVLDGTIQKVRTQELDEKSTLVVVDFRLTNPADYKFMVKEVQVVLDVDGAQQEGATVAEIDARRLFDYYKALGPKFNDSFKTRDVLQPKESADRMIAAQFNLPETKVGERKSLKVRIQEVDGPVTELVEKR